MTEQKCTCQKVPELNYVSSDPDCPVCYPKIDREKKWREEFEQVWHKRFPQNVMEIMKIKFSHKLIANQFWLESQRRFVDQMKDKPKIVCLCSSTRFKDAFDEANYQETMKGNIVLSVGFYMHATGNKHGDGIGCTPEQKIALDELHKRKIDLADEVLILNVEGYIGESTKSEIEYAKSHGKVIRYLENDHICPKDGK